MGFGINSTAPERFFAKVKPVGDCLEWTARRDDDGYGRFRPDGANTSDIGAHRVAFVLGGGVLKDGDQVLHTCDNPPCVRFEHLFKGTIAINMADRDRKGRQAQGSRSGAHTKPERVARGERNGRRTKPERTARGEWNGNARWTADDIREIRAAYAAGESQGSIARRFGTAQQVISGIVRRKAWAHVP